MTFKFENYHLSEYLMCGFLCLKLLSINISKCNLGAPRPPFDDIIRRIASLNNTDKSTRSSPAVISVDIPSGWHVEEGDISGEGIKPDMLVSFFCENFYYGIVCFVIDPSIIFYFNSGKVNYCMHRWILLFTSNVWSSGIINSSKALCAEVCWSSPLFRWQICASIHQS